MTAAVAVWQCSKCMTWVQTGAVHQCYGTAQPLLQPSLTEENLRRIIREEIRAAIAAGKAE